jgi:hypothetical protein
MSIRQILTSRAIIAVVPDVRKADAVVACLESRRPRHFREFMPSERSPGARSTESSSAWTASRRSSNTRAPIQAAEAANAEHRRALR